MLRSRRGGSRIYYENIVADGFSSAANAGITKADALATIHVIRAKDGAVLRGLEALTAMYDLVGLGWVFQLAKLPGLSQAAEILYKLVSKNRTALGAGMDSVSGGLLSLSRIAMEERGEGSCAEDGECREGYSKNPAPAAAQPAAPSAPGALPPSHSGPAGGSPAADSSASAPGGEAARVRGSALDRQHILGVYYTSRDGSSYLRAAPVDVVSGTLLAPEEKLQLGTYDVESLIDGVQTLIGQLQWDGVIGVGLPGLLRHAHEEAPAPPRADGGSASSVPSSDIVVNALAKRHARLLCEQEMQEATEREVTVMTGAEANGYAEMQYGAGKGERGVVLMVTLSRGIGCALFDDGVLLRNIDTAEHTWSWNLQLNASGVPSLPSKDTPATDRRWRAWAERVQSYLRRLDAAFHPDVIIVGGAAGEVAFRWLHLMDGITAPLRAATLGASSGVLGAAVGGKLQIALRDDLARVRAAVGRAHGVSPQLITLDQLRNVFDSFDSDGSGTISPGELSSAVQALGVRLPKEELRKVVVDVDVDNSGQISFQEFAAWWQELVSSSPVTYLHTEEEFDTIVSEESTSGRLVILEVGFTYCKPCKRFEPIYQRFAKHYSTCRFLRVNGNENVEMVHLGRDRLQLKSSPSFFFFVNGKEVHRHSGASEDKFQAALSKHCPGVEPLIVVEPLPEPAAV